MKSLNRFLWIPALIAAILCLGSSRSPAQTKVKVKDLAPQYQEWLKIVDYIIKDKEREVFLYLQNDRDRNLFMDAFWKVRDPTPATPQNEFKEEHLKRFQEANKKFHFGSAREGWMTDQGRIYIILGPPLSKSYFAGSNDLYPTETWSYYGDTAKGMPTHFELMFYQWRNSGEMRLYDPVSDGPGRLLVNAKDYMPTDYATMYDKIFDLQPDVARVCLSIIPGDIPPGYQPSLQSTLYMAAILESPKKGFDDKYATHFLNFKGVVSTEYLTNFMKTEADIAILPDPQTGLMFCDFVLSPERLSLDFYEPREEYSTNFQIDVNLRAGETVVLQYGKDFPLTIPAAQIAGTESMGVAIADSFPVIEGKFKLTVLLRNTVGKEFSVFEKDIEVPPVGGQPRLSLPVFGGRLVDGQRGARLPFQVADKKLNVDPKKTYAASDEVTFIYSLIGLSQDICKNGSVGILIKGASAMAPFEKSYSVPLRAQAFRPSMIMSQAIPAADMPPDYYEMTLSLRDGEGAVLDKKSGQFIISPVKSVAHPIIVSKAFSLGSSFMFQYMLAYQYGQTGQTRRAEEAYRRALDLNPSYNGKIPEYATFLVKGKRFAEALALLERIQDDAKLKFQYQLLKGRSLAGLERYDEAILSLQEGNAIYDSDAGLLAVLGTCYYKTGNKQRALAALKASFRLNPEQADVKALIQEIETKK
jgi:GWxTD domain-containing protein